MRVSNVSDRSTAFILWFDELTKTDIPLVGGKTANLGEMIIKAGVPVPTGFAVTAYAYQWFIKENKLGPRITSILDQLKDPKDTQMLKKVGKEIRDLITAAPLPAKLRNEIKAAYKELAERSKIENPEVAVRSSATAEDLPGASFAGQQETYLNVIGAKQVVKAVQDCFASLYTDRAIYYREEKGFEHDAVALSAAVQLMVHSLTAGVIFTVDLRNGSRDVVTIEGAWGLGELVVQGKVTPDTFYIKKNNGEIIERKVTSKKVELVQLEGGGIEEKEVPAARQNQQILTDEEIVTLAKYGIQLEEHYEFPQDIEWGKDKRTNKLWILQSRPETAWMEGTVTASVTTTERNIIIQGLPASPGIAYGVAHKILSADDITDFKEGEILITKMTDPDWVPAMVKAAAIVTDEGGMTCHAAIVSRELGTPCIVGTGEVTQKINSGDTITVDASRGVVYEGFLQEVVAAKERAVPATTVAAFESPVTATKIYVNLGVPEKAEEVAKLPVDGVGLLREEFVWASHICRHPKHLIEIGEAQVAIDALADGIRKVCAAFYPRPVILRLSDFKTNEYRDLEGGEKFEFEEANPMIGYRGASRYYDPDFVPAFQLELDAIKKVREEYRLTNCWVMVPFCRTPEEGRWVIKLLEDVGLHKGPDFQIWVMAEIPSNVILADEFAQIFDGFSIGSNDLTQLVLGVDRDSRKLAHLFDERNPAVLRAIRGLIETAHKYGKTVSICGQAPSVYPDVTNFLVRSGIDSISVNPDVIIQTRKLVAQVEQRIILEKVTGDRKPDRIGTIKIQSGETKLD